MLKLTIKKKKKRGSKKNHIECLILVWVATALAFGEKKSRYVDNIISYSQIAMKLRNTNVKSGVLNFTEAILSNKNDFNRRGLQLKKSR